jgi:hypothetical protein
LRLWDIASALGVSISAVCAARQLLRDAGYVDYGDGRACTNSAAFFLARLLLHPCPALINQAGRLCAPATPDN